MSNLGAILASLQIDLGHRSDADATALASTLHAKFNRILDGRTIIPVIYPNLASAASANSGGSAWSLGSYAVIIASGTLTAHNLVGFIVASADTTSFQIDFASGEPGAEVVKHREPFVMQSAAGAIMPVILARPKQVPANAAMSFRHAAAIGTSNLKLWAVFEPRPEV